MSCTATAMSPKYGLRQRIAAYLIRHIPRRHRDGSSTARAKEEIRLAGLFDKDSDYGGMIGEALEELLDVFAKQGHSGFSASHVADSFHRLVRGEVLSPLKGTPDEWTEVYSNENGEPVFQNKRMSSVFATGPNGEGACFLHGRVFVPKHGGGFTRGGGTVTGKGSSVAIVFPCIPKTVYIREGTPEAEEFAEVFQD